MGMHTYGPGSWKNRKCRKERMEDLYAQLLNDWPKDQEHSAALLDLGREIRSLRGSVRLPERIKRESLKMSS